MTEGLEAALARTQEAIEVAQKAASTATRELKRARSGAATGQVRDLRRALAAAEQAAAALGETARAARASYSFDEVAHLASGGYVSELLCVAAERGVAMVEEDEQLLCYPSLIKLLPADAALQIDRRRERRLRPSVVIEALASAQDRPPRFKAEPFLECLAAAYSLLAVREDKPAPILRLDAVWSALTLLPGQTKEYSRPEFARDLYQLDRAGVRTTKAGRTLRWHASTGTRGAGVLTTVADTGQQQRYWGVSFA